MKFINKMCAFFKKNDEKIINIVLILLSINVVFYIFLFCKSLLNSDSSFIVDYSLEQIRTKSIFPINWYNSNDFWIYSLIPLITLFLKIGIGVFASRQISVFIQTIFFFWLIYDFYKNSLNDKKGLKIFLLLILSGISGQMMFELYGDATYATIILYMLLELHLFIKYFKSTKRKYLIISGVFLSLISACSLRFPIFIAAPLIIVTLFFIYQDGLQGKYLKVLFTIILASIIGYIGNNLLTHYLLFMRYVDLGVVSNYDELLENIIKSAFNYTFLSGSTGLNVYSLTMYNTIKISSSSPFIVVLFIKFIYTVITIIMPFRLFKKFSIMKIEEKILYLFVISFTGLILFFLLIDNMSFWYRYLIPVVFFINMLIPLYYKYYFKNCNKKKVVFHISLVCISLTSILLVCNSFFDIKELALRENRYQKIIVELEKKGLSFGYTLDGNEHNLYRTLSNGKIQVIRLSHDGTKANYWLSSKDWFSEEYYHGKVFLIRKKDDISLEIEKESIDYFQIENYEVFVFGSNKDILDNISIED